MRRRIRGMLLSGRQFSLDSRIDLVQGTLQEQQQQQQYPASQLPLMREDSVETNNGHDVYNSVHSGEAPCAAPACRRHVHLAKHARFLSFRDCRLPKAKGHLLDFPARLRDELALLNLCRTP